MTDVRAAAAAAASSSPPPALPYPTTTEYALLMNRFKLMNLVQKVAHRDVLDLIETAGLEALSFKGVSFLNGAAAAAATSTATAQETPVKESAARAAGGRPAPRTTRIVRRQAPSSSVAAAARRDRSATAAAAEAAPVVRRHKVVRSEAQERAFYSRLAAPKRRAAAAEPVVEEFVVYNYAQPDHYEPPSPLLQPESPAPAPVKKVVVRGDRAPARPRHTHRDPDGDWSGGGGGRRVDGSQYQHYSDDARYDHHHHDSHNHTEYRNNDHHPHSSNDAGGRALDVDVDVDVSGETDGPQTEQQHQPRSHNRYSGSLQGDQESGSPAAAPGRSLTAAQQQQQPLPRRSMAPKAKPRGAPSAEVPFDVIQHAAVLMASTPPAPVQRGAAAASQNDASYGGQKRNSSGSFSLGSRDASRRSGTALPPPGTVPAGAMGGGGRSYSGSSGGGEVTRATSTVGLGGHTLEELARAVDTMLSDHMSILERVSRTAQQQSSPPQQPQPDRAAADTSAGSDAEHSRRIEQILRGNLGDFSTSSSATATDGNHHHNSSSGADTEALDEALLYSRLSNKIQRMDADMEQIMNTFQRNSAVGGSPAEPTAAALSKANAAAAAAADSHAFALSVVEDGGTSAGDGVYATGPDGEPGGVDTNTPATATATAAAATTAAGKRRVRGSLPPAIVNRLLASRKENFEYIQYNERLWNTSPVSQYVFAQRLTNAIFEDCFSEVMAEVACIMDEYVEELAEHELQ